MKAARPLHQPFSWLHKSLQDDRDAQQLSTTYDLFRGINLSLEIVHSSNLERMHNEECDEGDENRPMLDVADSETMLLFVKSAVQLLALQTEAEIERFNERARRAEQ